jgi:methionine-R-sulfoxide reductase
LSGASDIRLQGPTSASMNDSVKSEDEWREILPPDRYRVLRLKGTEKPFSGKLLKVDHDGIYLCGGCGSRLFRSEEKFDSGCGWPSFLAPITDGAIEEREDLSHGMKRTEIVCARCGGHLGHVFEDGPAPTGRRYCVNSLSLDFVDPE